jgi:SAM-dependent methyltransferase
VDLLRERTLAFIRKGQANFGFGETIVERDLAKTLDPNWQSDLSGMIARTINEPAFWSTTRSTLEVGCGSGYFVTGGLALGHDAWGLDNDDGRLELGRLRIDTFGWPAVWKDRLVLGDATATGFEPGRFDLVLGHQFIEHVPDPAGTISELLRVTKHGGYVVLYAPDYRAPFEAHYEIPWPPFISRDRAKAWLDGFERPHGGLDLFYYTTAPHIASIFEPLDCRIVQAYNDRRIEQQAMRHFDCSTSAATLACAKKIRAAFEARQLPEHFTIATSFGIAVQKL